MQHAKSLSKDTPPPHHHHTQTYIGTKWPERGSSGIVQQNQIPEAEQTQCNKTWTTYNPSPPHTLPPNALTKPSQAKTREYQMSYIAQTLPFTLVLIPPWGRLILDQLQNCRSESTSSTVMIYSFVRCFYPKRPAIQSKPWAEVKGTKLHSSLWSSWYNHILWDRE